MTVDELASVASRIRAAGESVVLCHGVFDLLHIGHVRHLQAASREGDALMVTVTADAYVNKGPDRPVFTEQLRAEMLASLEYVDYVAVNHAPTAESVLVKVKPDVYVKGSDYADPDDDVSGKIRDEQETVKRNGRRVVFTKELTFSSSSLLNNYFDVFDPEVSAYLRCRRQDLSADALIELIERVADYRVLFVGSTIIDEYHYVDPLGKSPKENLIATQFVGREEFAGGVIAAANHAASFCREIEVITSLGAAEAYEDLVRSSVKPNVKLNLIMREGAPTTAKRRFVDRAYLRKLFEVYRMDDTPLPSALTETLNARIRERAADADLVIVTDFGHGLIGPSTVAALTQLDCFLAVNTQTNSANTGYNLITKYPRADFVCIDAPEARLAVAEKHASMERVVGELLAQRINCRNLIVTQGRKGCLTFNGSNGLHAIPAFTKTVVDTIGAGDAFFAVAAPLMAAGGAIEDVGFIGSAAGAIKVGIVGHRSPVEKIALIKFITTLLK